MNISERLKFRQLFDVHLFQEISVMPIVKISKLGFEFLGVDTRSQTNIGYKFEKLPGTARNVLLTLDEIPRHQEIKLDVRVIRNVFKHSGNLKTFPPAIQLQRFAHWIAVAKIPPRKRF